MRQPWALVSRQRAAAVERRQRRAAGNAPRSAGAVRGDVRTDDLGRVRQDRPSAPSNLVRGSRPAWVTGLRSPIQPVQEEVGRWWCVWL